MIHIEESILGL